MSIATNTLLAAVAFVSLATMASAQPPNDRDPAELMTRADTDGDGKVSRDEFIKSRTARLEEAFARMDTDGDGKLSREEVAARMARARQFMQRNGQSPGGRGRLDRGGRDSEEGFRKPPQQ